MAANERAKKISDAEPKVEAKAEAKAEVKAEPKAEGEAAVLVMGPSPASTLEV